MVHLSLVIVHLCSHFTASLGHCSWQLPLVQLCSQFFPWHSKPHPPPVQLSSQGSASQITVLQFPPVQLNSHFVGAEHFMLQFPPEIKQVLGNSIPYSTRVLLNSLTICALHLTFLQSTHQATWWKEYFSPVFCCYGEKGRNGKKKEKVKSYFFKTSFGKY